jgi:hypothetical protein
MVHLLSRELEKDHNGREFTETFAVHATWRGELAPPRNPY